MNTLAVYIMDSILSYAQAKQPKETEEPTKVEERKGKRINGHIQRENIPQDAKDDQDKHIQHVGKIQCTRSTPYPLSSRWFHRP